jgi:hypothetical protein
MKPEFPIDNARRVIIYTGPDLTGLVAQTRSRLSRRRRKAERLIKAAEERYEIVVPTGLIWIWSDALEKAGHRDPHAGMTGGDVRTSQFFYFLELLKKHVDHDMLRELCSPEFWNDELSPKDRNDALQYCMTHLVIYAKRYVSEIRTEATNVAMDDVARSEGARVALNITMSRRSG